MTELNPRSVFVWRRRQPSILVSAHHDCAPLPNGGTRVELTVEMVGPVGEAFGRLYRRHTKRYLAMRGAGLKPRAETTAR